MRPRRFGKSFAVHTLAAYYDVSCDSRPLFEGLAIAHDQSFATHLNAYDEESQTVSIPNEEVRLEFAATIGAQV